MSGLSKDKARDSIQETHEEQEEATSQKSKIDNDGSKLSLQQDGSKVSL